MRTTRRALLTIVTTVAALAVGPAGPLGAAAHAQECSGPAATKQSGRATIAPGVNALALPQDVTLSLNLFSCSPSRTTRGAGALHATIDFETGQTCALFTQPHTVHVTASVTWKNDMRSTIATTLALSGASQNVVVSGTVTKGLFKNHPVRSQLHYTEVVSPQGVSTHGPGIAQACKNRTRPNRYGRVSIVTLTFTTTKAFVII